MVRRGGGVVAALALALALALVAGGGDARCVKWRATKGCDPHGERNPRGDAACSATVAGGAAGYCECEDRRRVREVDCDHHAFTCEAACAEDSSAELSYPQGFELVTCGSTIKLVHEPTRFRLHSHEIAYGGGSGQQSVTAHAARNDPNSYWLVKEADGELACAVGAPVQCGAALRLEHIGTRRNLHSHTFAAPLTNALHEVSGFGVAGEGDSGDSWVLDCEESMQCSAADQCADAGLWRRGALVRLRNANTGRLLATSAASRFDDSNCPRCPINGQQEVGAAAAKTDGTLWFAGEGIYVTQ